MKLGLIYNKMKPLFVIPIKKKSFCVIFLFFCFTMFSMLNFQKFIFFKVHYKYGFILILKDSRTISVLNIVPYGW